MPDIRTLMNGQVRLAARPAGLPNEDVVSGLDVFPQPLLKPFDGENVGRLALEVASA